MLRRRRIFAATTWDLTEAFFAAQRAFHEIYVLYETQVLAHAEEQLVDRRHLRLDADEVSKLLDFERLKALRGGPLYRTLEISHSLFRSAGKTSKFDRTVSEIYHELSILREEQFKVSTFAAGYREDNQLAEYESLLDEVHEDFPRRVHNLHALFKRAQRQLENVLRNFRYDPIYLRSLYLFGETTMAEAYSDGLQGHAWRVFDRGLAEAFLHAARSFAQRGFKSEALAALDRASQELEHGLPSVVGDGQQDSPGFAELAGEIERSRQQLAELSPVELVGRLSHETREPLLSDASAPDLPELEQIALGDESELEEIGL